MTGPPISNGARYFKCDANKGIFVRSKSIKSKLGNPECATVSSPKSSHRQRRPRSQSNRMRGRATSRQSGSSRRSKSKSRKRKPKKRKSVSSIPRKRSTRSSRSTDSNLQPSTYLRHKRRISQELTVEIQSHPQQLSLSQKSKSHGHVPSDRSFDDPSFSLDALIEGHQSSAMSASSVCQKENKPPPPPSQSFMRSKPRAPPTHRKSLSDIRSMRSTASGASSVFTLPTGPPPPLPPRPQSAKNVKRPRSASRDQLVLGTAEPTYKPFGTNVKHREVSCSLMEGDESHFNHISIANEELWQCVRCLKRHKMEFRFCPFCGGQKSLKQTTLVSKPKLIGYKQREDRHSDTSSEDRTEDEGDFKATTPRKARMKRRKPRPVKSMRSRSRNRERKVIKDWD